MNKNDKIKEVKLLLSEYEKTIIEIIESNSDRGLSSFELILGAAQTGLVSAKLVKEGYSIEEIKDILLKLSDELLKTSETDTKKLTHDTTDDTFEKDSNYEDKKKTFH